MKTLQQRWLNTMLNVLTFFIFGPKQGRVNLGDQNRGGVFPFLLIEAHTHCFLASISIPIVQAFLSGSWTKKSQLGSTFQTQVGVEYNKPPHDHRQIPIASFNQIPIQPEETHCFFAATCSAMLASGLGQTRIRSRPRMRWRTWCRCPICPPGHRQSSWTAVMGCINKPKKQTQILPPIIKAPWHFFFLKCQKLEMHPLEASGPVKPQ